MLFRIYWNIYQDNSSEIIEWMCIVVILFNTITKKDAIDAWKDKNFFRYTYLTFYIFIIESKTTKCFWNDIFFSGSQLKTQRKKYMDQNHQTRSSQFFIFANSIDDKKVCFVKIFCWSPNWINVRYMIFYYHEWYKFDTMVRKCLYQNSIDKMYNFPIIFYNIQYISLHVIVLGYG